MVSLDLHFVNELIAVRQVQHGGARGAPLIQNGHRVGASINRSCIVMLSALLQTYVEDVFAETSFEKLNLTNQSAKDAYRRTFARWGNPSDENIRELFRRLGITNVFAGLSWQAMAADRIPINLKNLNVIRNQVAHGKRTLDLNNARYSLSLAEAVRFRDFVQSFSDRFETHVRQLAGL